MSLIGKTLLLLIPSDLCISEREGRPKRSERPNFASEKEAGGMVLSRVSGFFFRSSTCLCKKVGLETCHNRGSQPLQTWQNIPRLMAGTSTYEKYCASGGARKDIAF